MKIKTLKSVRLPTGSVVVGAEIEVPNSLAKFFIERGEAKALTPVIENKMIDGAEVETKKKKKSV